MNGKKIISKMSWKESLDISKKIHFRAMQDYPSFYESDRYKEMTKDKSKIKKKLTIQLLILLISIAFVFLLIFSFENALPNAKKFTIVVFMFYIVLSLFQIAQSADLLGVIKIYGPLIGLIVKVRLYFGIISFAKRIHQPLTIIINEDEHEIKYYKKNKEIAVNVPHKLFRFENIFIIKSKEENNNEMLIFRLEENDYCFLNTLHLFYQKEIIEHESRSDLIDDVFQQHD